MKTPQITSYSKVKTKSFPPKIRNKTRTAALISTQHHIQALARKIRNDKTKRQPNWKEVKLCLFPFDMVLYNKNPKEPTKLY